MSKGKFGIFLLFLLNFNNSNQLSSTISQLNFLYKDQLQIENQDSKYESASFSGIATFLFDNILQSTIECSNSTENIKILARRCRVEREIIKLNAAQNKDWATSCKYYFFKNIYKCKIYE